MKRRALHLTVLLVVAALMFLASGQHGSYFRVSLWAGDGPIQGLPPMPILSLDHVQLAIPVGGEDRAREFYRGILGLSEVEKPVPMAGRNSIWFTAGTASVHPWH